MEYIIYEMVAPDHLIEHNYENYGHKIIQRYILKELDAEFQNKTIRSRHPSMESALEEIKRTSTALRSMQLTVLPVLDINWEGKTKES